MCSSAIVRLARRLPRREAGGPRRVRLRFLRGLTRKESRWQPSAASRASAALSCAADRSGKEGVASVAITSDTRLTRQAAEPESEVAGWTELNEAAVAAGVRND